MDNENFLEREEEKIEEVASCEQESDLKENLEQKSSLNVEETVSEAPVLDEKALARKEKLKKKRKKWKVWYIVLLCLAGFYTACLILAGGIALMDYFLTKEEEIDIDESFEISDLTEKQILTKDSYCIASSYKFITNGYDYSQVDYEYIPYDYGECYFEAANMSGIRTVSASYAEDAYIILTIKAQSNVSKDDAKIVITSESEILAEFDANSEITYTVKSDDYEHVFVKILADEADVSVTVTRRIIGFNDSPDI